MIAKPYFRALGHWPAAVGTAMSMLGIFLVAAGWMRIHRAEGLVTTGVYRYMRHPQYTGILLFTLGWILHYPCLITLLLWPILVAAYVWLAKQEESHALEMFGEAYARYAEGTKRFIPYLV
jgi:protein-S-isoprenylcysteine O-methyltransferase Ste14